MEDEDDDKTFTSIKKYLPSSEKRWEDQKGIHPRDSKQPNKESLKNDATQLGTTRSESNEREQLEVPNTQAEFASSPSSNMWSVCSSSNMPTAQEENCSTVQQKVNKSCDSNSVDTAESTSDCVSSNEPSKFISSQQQGKSTKRTDVSGSKRPSKINREMIVSPEHLQEPNPDTTQKRKPTDDSKVQSSLSTNTKKTAKYQPRKNETTDTMRIRSSSNQKEKLPPSGPTDSKPDKKQLTPDSKKTAMQQPREKASAERKRLSPITNARPDGESKQKKISASTSSSCERESCSESQRTQRSSYKEISVPTEEPMLNAAQKDLLPDFKVILLFYQACFKLPRHNRLARAKSNENLLQRSHMVYNFYVWSRRVKFHSRQT